MHKVLKQAPADVQGMHGFILRLRFEQGGDIQDEGPQAFSRWDHGVDGLAALGKVSTPRPSCGCG